MRPSNEPSCHSFTSITLLVAEPKSQTITEPNDHNPCMFKLIRLSIDFDLRGPWISHNKMVQSKSCLTHPLIINGIAVAPVGGHRKSLHHHAEMSPRVNQQGGNLILAGMTVPDHLLQFSAYLSNVIQNINKKNIQCLIVVIWYRWYHNPGLHTKTSALV